jgi:hypothetical protein
MKTAVQKTQAKLPVFWDCQYLVTQEGGRNIWTDFGDDIGCRFSDETANLMPVSETLA